MKNYNTPAVASLEFADTSAAKASMPLARFAVSAVLGGAFIAFGGLLTVAVVGNSTGLLSQNMGLAKFLAGALFPVGLIMVSLTGADLFTSDCAGAALAGFGRKSSWAGLAKLLILSYIFNFFGAQLLAYIFTHKCGVLSGASTQYLFKYVDAKLHYDFTTVVMKGIAANWLVCLGTWMGYAAKDVIGKCIGIWIPVMIFVTLGYEHSIANMYFVPTAIYLGADITWSDFITHNLIPATIGNLIGGFVFVGCAYYFQFLSARPAKPECEC